MGRTFRMASPKVPGFAMRNVRNPSWCFLCNKLSSGSGISYHREVAQVMAVSEAWCGEFGCSGWLNIPLGLRVGQEGLVMDWEGVKSGMLMPAFRAKTKKDKSNE